MNNIDKQMIDIEKDIAKHGYRFIDRIAVGGGTRSRIARIIRMMDGGEGSGNFGHSGRPGKVGGSLPEGEKSMEEEMEEAFEESAVEEIESDIKHEQKEKAIEERVKNDAEVLFDRIVESEHKYAESDPYRQIELKHDNDDIYDNSESVARQVENTYDGVGDKAEEFDKRLSARKEFHTSKNDANQRLYVERLDSLYEEHKDDENIMNFRMMLYKDFDFDDATEIEEEDIYKLYGTEDTAEITRRFFDIMRENGCYNPYKDNAMTDHRSVINDEARTKDLIQASTGCDSGTAKRIADSMREHTASNIGRTINTDNIDKYVSSDKAEEKEIYRGLNLKSEVLEQLLKPGATFTTIDGNNMSWTTDLETAISFSNGDEHSVVIKCLKKKTSSPIRQYSRYDGEYEVISHSKAEWTVLFAKQGDYRTFIYVVEKNQML